MRERMLLIYRGILEDALFSDLACLIDDYERRKAKKEAAGKTAGADGVCGGVPDEDGELTKAACRCMGGLLRCAAEYGFHGNLWHCYLANLLVNDENPYSISCEITGGTEGSLNKAALHDMEILREFFACDFGAMMVELHAAPSFSFAGSYERSGKAGHVYHAQIRDRICHLAEALGQKACSGRSADVSVQGNRAHADASLQGNRAHADDAAERMKALLTQFYQEYGVGGFGLHKAFRVEQSGTHAIIKPILNIQHVEFDDLVGYDLAKKKLIDNTEAFVAGRPANNCLLYGDAGTGKSTSIKGILNRYYDRGLRIIELYKHQFQCLSDVISQIKNRNYRFIIYMDDLSFEEFEIEYKYLKAVIEGGLEKKPDNVLIYATSNRRHLIRESFKDKAERDDELHTNDTVQEKLSLVSRFGVTIYFGAPGKTEFEEIVCVLAERNQITMPRDELLLEANRWELAHGGRSGRCAQQFIDYIKGGIKDGSENICSD